MMQQHSNILRTLAIVTVFTGIGMMVPQNLIGLVIAMVLVADRRLPRF